MSGHSRGIAMRLMRRLPPGFFADTAWLKRQGVSRQLAHAYAQRGVLEHVAYGLYRRPEIVGAPQPVNDWVLPVLSAQWIMEYDVHVGATTALHLTGNRHDLPLGGKEDLYLYASNMPAWINRLEIRARLRLRNKRLFSDPEAGITTTDSALSATSGSAAGTWPLKLSSPERAILETIDELPDNESFRTLDMTFQSLVNLRPNALTALLERCRSVQVKRLFFVLADKHAHRWRKYVDPRDFDLGSGDRAFTKSGRLHPTYRITVPRDFVYEERGSDGA